MRNQFHERPLNTTARHDVAAATTHKSDSFVPPPTQPAHADRAAAVDVAIGAIAGTPDQPADAPQDAPCDLPARQKPRAEFNAGLIPALPTTCRPATSQDAPRESPPAVPSDQLVDDGLLGALAEQLTALRGQQQQLRKLLDDALPG